MNPNRKYRDFASPFATFWQKWLFTANLLRPGCAAQYAYPVVYGIDISRWQPDPIDWDALYDGGYRFVILKATDGGSAVDPQFDRWMDAWGAGLRIMPYHFFRDNVSGVAQANHFLATCDPLYRSVNRNTRFWLDVETNEGASVAVRQTRIRETLTILHPLGGVYSSPSLWQSLTGNMPLPVGAAGWVAHWTSATQPMIPGGWARDITRLWQIGISGSHSWVPAVPGVSGRCDVDVFFGDEGDLDAWLGDQSPPDPLESRVADLERRVTALEQRLQTPRAVVINNSSDTYIAPPNPDYFTDTNTMSTRGGD